MIPGSSPPLRNCSPASGSSASISQSRASVLARAVKGALPAIGSEGRLRLRPGKQGRGAVGAQHVEAVGQRDLGVEVEKLLLDRLLFEPRGAQREREASELAVGERQHGDVAFLAR